MKRRGRHRANKDPTDNFLRNRFEVLDVEDTKEDNEYIEDELISESNVPLNKLEKKKLKIKRSKLEVISENSEEDCVDGENNKTGETTSSDEKCSSQEDLETTSSSEKYYENTEVREKLVNVVQFTQLQPSKLLTVDLKVKDSKFEGILDTGADSNMIKRSVIQNLDFKIHTDRKRTFRGLGVAEQQTLGKVWMPFSLFGVNVENTPFEVVEDHVIAHSAILGRKFISLKKITIDAANNRISVPTSPSSKIDIYQDDSEENRRVIYESLNVYCTQTTMVSKNLTKVPVSYNYYDEIEVDSEVKLYFEGKSNNKKLEGVDGIMKPNADDKFIFMKRKEGELEDKCRIKKGEIVGHISTIIDLDEEESHETDWDIDKLKGKVDVGDSMTNEQKESIYNMLLKTKFALSSNDEDIGKAKVTPHKIVLTNNTPIWQKPRRFSDPVNEEIERQCKQLEAMDIIEKSDSPWSSPIVPVRKADGTLRLCVDYRRVNSVTRPEKFPMPNLYDSIYSAHNIKFFTKIDLVKGYYQIPIDEESRPLTSFSTQHDQYQFKRLSFGLRNSGIQFQRNMQEILSDFNSKRVIIYIDDILVISETFEEQLETVEKVLTTLMENGIKVKVSKCEFFKEEVSFLGHVISSQGIKKCPSYIEKIENFPKPENVNQLRRFLGLANFQRKFVDNFSVIAKPLSKLTNGSKRKPIVWTEEMDVAYNKIKEKLVEEVTLSFPDYRSESEPLELYVDASGLGAGACLLQRQNGEYKTIAYSSTAFSATEQNYSTIERELLALRWGVKNFRAFLFGIHFIIFTDHKPLVYLRNMSRDNARLTRTLNELEDYDFIIKYRPGLDNEAADTLSRAVTASEEMEDKVREEELPAGLRVTEKIEGGGDSMFKSLLIVLENLNDSDFCEIPESHEDLRIKLVTHMVNNHSKFKMKLDKQRIKYIRAMMHKGVLPSDELLLAACDLFNVEIHVHHGMKWPVIFKTNKVDPIIKIVHLQCLSGIHYNPVASKKSVKISQKDKLINVLRVVEEQNEISPIDVQEETVEDPLKVMGLTQRALCKCNHRIEESSCTCIVSVGESKFCALLDTGAQVSLITEEVWNHLKENNKDLKFDIVDETLVGVGNQTNKIIGVTELKLKILNIEVDKAVPFAIVRTESLPWCALLGLNFLKSNHIILDFENLLTSYKTLEGVEVAFPMKTEMPSEEPSLFQGTIGIETLLQDEVSEETSCDEEEECENKLRYNIDESLVHIQECDHAIGNLKRKIKEGLNHKINESFLKQFKRYVSDLHIDSDVLFKNHKGRDLVVLPFSLITDIAVKTHEQLSHIGANKLLNLVMKQFWHPAIENICRDICKSCVHCQFYKVHRQHLKSPTLKIETGYPFEILAIDVMLLPKTSRGNLAVVVAIDHHSKWLTAVPIKNKTSATVTNALKNNILPCLPRIPDKILSDNGPEFRASTFNDFLSEYNIKHIFTTPYKPSSNGCVERSNRTIIQLLKGLIKDNRNNWDEQLTRALVTYNTTIHSELMTSPSEFLLHRAHECSQSLQVSKETIKTWKVGNPKFLPFAVDQKVLKKIQRSGTLVCDKLKPRYEGPYQIVEVSPNEVTYRIKHSEDENAPIIKVHYDQLKVFVEVPEYLNKYIQFDNISVRIKRMETECSLNDIRPTLNINDMTSSEMESDENKISDACKSVGKENSLFPEPVEQRNIFNSKSRSLNTTEKCQPRTVNEESCRTHEKWSSLDEFLRKFDRDLARLKTGKKPLDLASLRCSEPVNNLTCGDPRKIMTSTPNDKISLGTDFMGGAQVSSIPLRFSSSLNTFDSIDKMIINAPIASSNSQESENRSSSLKIICEQILTKNDDTQFKAFVELMDEAWSVSNQMLDLEISKTEEQISKSKSKTIESDKSESFEGFGQCLPSEQIGSARLNFLRAMKKHSSEYKDLTVEFISGRDARLKAVWDKKMRSSVLRLCPSISFSDSESSNVRSPLERIQTMTTRLHAMRTRSQGKPPQLPNVQVKTIEYKNKGSDLDEKQS